MRTPRSRVVGGAVGGNRVIALLAAWVMSGQATLSHVFEYRSETALHSVSLAGTFNNWDKSATPMAPGPDHRVWRTTLSLAPGKHLYKFVLDGERWVLDPRAERNEDDGNGNTNSVLVLLPDEYRSPARLGDGVIARTPLRHDASIPYRNFDRGRLTLVLRTRPGDIESVDLMLGDSAVPMRAWESDEMAARYAASIPWDGKRTVRYSFRLKDGATVLHFGPRGADAHDGGEFEVSEATFQPFVVPRWVEQTVLYQIFPDRFANGSSANDPKDRVAWDAEPTWFNRFGGDFAGVSEHIGYLESLGVGAIYFNPIFASPSNHRYETSDYHRVDPQLGTNEEFGALTRDLKKAGIRTILDGVFNHTAVDFAPFLDLREHGASSKYRDWYFPKSFPIRVEENPNYVAWFGFPSMPKVNLGNAEARAYMLGVPAFWHERAEVAGWRLDVANEVPMPFWQAFRKVVKGLDPQMWIVGEVWGDGSPWLGGDQWDSVMDYPFREACLGFFARKATTSEQFLGRLMGVVQSYAPQVSRNLMNLLSSHDTPRFITLCGDDPAMARLAALVQFTWVGAPSVYYGEELGMLGGADPLNRRGMRWDLATDANPMLRWYRALGALRGAVPALQSGDPEPLPGSGPDVVAFARSYQGVRVVVAVNRAGSPKPFDADLKGPKEGWVDALSGERHSSLGITLPAQGAAVLLPATPAHLELSSSLIRILGSKESS
ncbi:MAG: alpha amylase N-terminal ig-like domain-containing protein [Fimbriimonadaceae bacterium]|nr:alpha amylase N-terminal ig-like domain-containing protein [Fimbriimonadaceae bacterium]